MIKMSEIYRSIIQGLKEFAELKGLKDSVKFADELLNNNDDKLTYKLEEPVEEESTEETSQGS